jgi:exodeoxyribonuclease V alpha subunit
MSVGAEAGPAGDDPLDADLAQSASGLLGDFNRAGLLAAADVHVAWRLARLAGETDPRLALAAALAVRGPRFGHVYADLGAIREAATDVEEDIDLDALPWPDHEEWLQALAASRLVSVGDTGPSDRPLRLIGTALYLDRYWRDEGRVADDLLARAGGGRPRVDLTVLADGLARLFPDDRSGEQRWAAATAVLRRLSVVAGGPGTGKTTTVGRVLALLEEQALANGARPPLVGLAAPTGKAAARLEEAVHGEARRMDIDPNVRARILAVGASTLHRLLGRRPDSASRFRYDRYNHLPHDVLIVDETSMVSLSLMARVTEAVRPDARLILVGDPEQLASVEAGAVLGDVVGPASHGLQMTMESCAELEKATCVRPPAPPPARPATRQSAPASVPLGRSRAGIGDGIVVLRSNHRFGGHLADVATAVRAGDDDRVIDLLSAGHPASLWLPIDPDAEGKTSPRWQPIRSVVTSIGAALLEAAASADGERALEQLSQFRMLCAHRRGAAGVDIWTAQIEEWLAQSVDGFSAGATWYLGRPVLITANDYGLRLFNGDTGAVVARPEGGVGVVFRQGDGLVSVSPSRLSSAETVFATTVHKAQGSEFREVAVVLPRPESRILTRELLYTAVTRPRERLILASSEESIRVAMARPVARASGLTRRLWA